MSKHECHRIKCDKQAQYYAFQLNDPEVSGFFCYWHLPERWITEPLVGGA